MDAFSSVLGDCRGSDRSGHAAELVRVQLSVFDWGDSRPIDEERVRVIRADGSSQRVLWRVMTDKGVDECRTAVLALRVGDRFIVTRFNGMPGRLCEVDRGATGRWDSMLRQLPPAHGLRLDILGARMLRTTRPGERPR